MASKLALITDLDNWVKVRDRIALILTEELANQYTLADSLPVSNPEFYQSEVFIERAQAFAWSDDDNELKTAVVVRFDSFNNKQNASGYSTDYLATVQYKVDVISASRAQGTDSADLLASKKSDLIISLVRNILMAETYTLLDYLPEEKVVSKKSILSVQRYQPESGATGTFRGIGSTLTFEVDVFESSPKESTNNLNLIHTQTTNHEDQDVFRADFDTEG